MVRGVGMAAVALIVLAGTACAINPATGKRQLSLIGESQEISMGQSYHPEILSSMGQYESESLQGYVEQVGKKLAATSERHELPWTFTVVDDAAVNAFAVPGGYIYITRGILAYMNSEAEMASVVGHEIGHVTARHSVNQMSKQQLAGLGLGLGSMIPEVRDWGLDRLASTGLGLIFLRFSRDDERQSDDLGLRYVMRAGYDPRPMADMFDTLDRISRESGGRVPGWLSTHPAPENRRETILGDIARIDVPLDGRRVARDEFLDQIDGITFGEDPRGGYFKESRFLHPGMAFELTFPAGWKTANLRDVVGASSPEEDAVLKLSLSKEQTPAAAAEKFFGQEGVQRGAGWTERIGGIPAVTGTFVAAGQQTELRGVTVFLKHRDRVFQILGLTTAEAWPAREAALRNAASSFLEVTDRAVLAVRPAQLQVRTLSRPMDLETVRREYDCSVPVDVLAGINHVEASHRFSAGERVKIVVGGDLP